MLIFSVNVFYQFYLTCITPGDQILIDWRNHHESNRVAFHFLWIFFFEYFSLNIFLWIVSISCQFRKRLCVFTDRVSVYAALLRFRIERLFVFLPFFFVAVVVWRRQDPPSPGLSEMHQSPDTPECAMPCYRLHNSLNHESKRAPPLSYQIRAKDGNTKKGNRSWKPAMS